MMLQTDSKAGKQRRLVQQGIFLKIFIQVMIAAIESGENFSMAVRINLIQNPVIDLKTVPFFAKHAF